MDPVSLLPGTQVGAWRVVSRHGSGSYGVVYRVERVGQVDATPFALKLARHPLDPRFEREGELLSRIRHHHVPGFEARGWLTFPGGVAFPYVVMEWVEGMPLYEWGALKPRTSREVLRLLSQVARALEATHAVEGVHRDVKGDNVLVRAEDGTAVLMDFGSGYFRGAPVLTRQPPPPGTGKYWSPECLRFQWKWLRHPTMRYEAGPADDVYALGVTAYRLVTGVYPPPGVDFVETEDGTQLVQPAPVPVETRVTVCPELATLITQMLSDEPSVRGSAAELAEALERAASTTGLQADLIISPVAAQAPPGSTPPLSAQEPTVRGLLVPTQAPTVSESPAPSRASKVSTPRVTPPGHALESSQRLVVAVGVLLVLGVGWVVHKLSGLESAGVSKSGEGASKQDAGVVGLGDEVPAAPVVKGSTRTGHSSVNVDMAKKPFPGQHRPPCQKPAVEINDGCWIHLGNVTPPCGTRYFEWNKGCYLPVFELPQPPTSGDP